MDWLNDIVTNYILISAVTGWFIAQMIKCFTGVFKVRHFSLTALFFGTGGMPSSHSAAVCALATSCAIACGFDSSQFAIASVLTIVVMRDAMGIRREVGEHAKTLNMIIKEFQSSKGEDDGERLRKAHKDLVGHTPLQVFIGGFVGIVCAVVMSYIPVFACYAA